MLEVYWICLIFGVLFALTTILFGEILGQVFDGICEFVSGDHLEWLQTMLVVTWLTVFGGSGVLSTYYCTDFDARMTLAVSLLTATVLCKVFYFSYVKPMRNSENSTGVSLKDLVGKPGEVIVPVPADGYGEVLIRAGASNTNQIAASSDRVGLSVGCEIIVVDIKDGVLYVSQKSD